MHWNLLIYSTFHDFSAYLFWNIQELRVPRVTWYNVTDEPRLWWPNTSIWTSMAGNAWGFLVFDWSWQAPVGRFRKRRQCGVSAWKTWRLFNVQFWKLRPSTHFGAATEVTQHLKWATKFHRQRGVHVTPTVFVNGLEVRMLNCQCHMEMWPVWNVVRSCILWYLV